MTPVTMPEPKDPARRLSGTGEYIRLLYNEKVRMAMAADRRDGRFDEPYPTCAAVVFGAEMAVEDGDGGELVDAIRAILEPGGG